MAHPKLHLKSIIFHLMQQSLFQSWCICVFLGCMNCWNQDSWSSNSNTFWCTLSQCPCNTVFPFFIEIKFIGHKIHPFKVYNSVVLPFKVLPLSPLCSSRACHPPPAFNLIRFSSPSVHPLVIGDCTPALCLCGFASSGYLFKWDHIIRGLSRPASFA